MVHFSRISFDSCFGRSEFGEKLVAYDVFLIMVHFNSIFFIVGFYFLFFPFFSFFFCKMEFIERFVCIKCFRDFDPIMVHRDGYLT